MPNKPPRHRPGAGGTQHDPRPQSHKRGYDWAWRRLRAWLLHRSPLCRDCEDQGRVRPAADVHHVVKIADDPRRRLDPGNLRPLCRDCHNRRTAAGE